MPYDIYLRKGSKPVHMFRWRGSPDIKRTNRLFQEMIEDPLYGATLSAWTSVVIIGRFDAHEFQRIKQEPKGERWFP